MDDDLAFGASVWAASEPTIVKPIIASPPPITQAVSFDDFDDFGPPTDAETTHDEGGDDDFGDFGDFGEAEDLATPADFGEEGVGFEEMQIAGPSSPYADWEPLILDPMPSRQELEDQVNVILAPVWGDRDMSQFTTDEEIREVEGVSQILATPESRELYNLLFQSPPPTKPPNWTRSRIRRQHLIALGIPVNLDEVLPHANGKPLPPLHISTRPMSAPPGPRHPAQTGSTPASTNNSRSGTPQPGSGRQKQSPFGPKPSLDEGKISELLDIDPDNLTIQPLSRLEQQLSDIRSQTASTSALLTYLLQTREALQQDSETYNGLIAELVGEAQKIKTKGKPIRRGSGML